MDERKRLMDVIKGDTPDGLPWFADLSYLYQSLILKGELLPKYDGEEGYVDFHKDMGAGICFYAPALWQTMYDQDIVVSETKHGDENITSIKTPVGEVVQTMKYLPSTFTWVISEHFVKNINDLITMTYIREHSKYVPAFEEFKRIDKLWGNNGIAVGIAPISVSPLQKMLSRWAGVQTTIEILMDEPDAFREINERIALSEDPIFEIIEKSPSVLVEFPENLSSEITGRGLFEEFNLPYYEKRINQLHKAGKYVSIHIDGTLKGCFDLLQQTGFDIAEAVTPAPVGDISVNDLRMNAGDSIIIWGGLPGALFSPQYSEEIFESHLENVLDIFSRSPGYVLGVADQVPPDGLISRIRRVREKIG